MGIVFTGGFDTGSVVEFCSSSGSVSVVEPSTLPHATGSHSLRVSPAVGEDAWVRAIWEWMADGGGREADQDIEEAVVHFALRLDTLPAGTAKGVSDVTVEDSSSATAVAGLNIDEDGKLHLYDATYSDLLVSEALSVGAWHWIAFGFRTTSSSRLYLAVDGVELFNGAADVTDPVTGGLVPMLGKWGNITDDLAVDYLLDDVVITDSLDEVYEPGVHVVTLRPRSTICATNWRPFGGPAVVHGCMDDEPAHDSGATYAINSAFSGSSPMRCGLERGYASAAGEAVCSLFGSDARIRGLDVLAWMSVTAGASGQFGQAVALGTAEYSILTTEANLADWAESPNRGHWATSPFSGAAWSATELAALEAGVAASDLNDDVCKVTALAANVVVEPSDQDPYTKALEALWAILEARSDFTSLVRPSNRIKFTSIGTRRSPIKEQVSTADLPEVRIIVTGSQPAARGSSCSAFDMATYEVQVSSGDQRLDDPHLPLKWAIMRAMLRERTILETLQALTWNGRRFVVGIKPTSVREGVTEADLNRGIHGWAGVWAIDVEMAFRTADL